MNDDFDSGDDDLSTMLIMDEMDDEDRCFDAHSGCLVSTTIIIGIPVILLLKAISIFF